MQLDLRDEYLENVIGVCDEELDEREDVGDVLVVGLDEPHIEHMATLSECLLRHTRHAHFEPVPVVVDDDVALANDDMFICCCCEY